MNTKLTTIAYSIVLSLLLVLSAIVIFTDYSHEQTVGQAVQEEPVLGANGTEGAQWMAVSKFDGYQTKNDPTKVSNGANPQGQNTTVFEGDRFGVRELGYDLFPEGTSTTTASKINGIHTFRKRSGENIMMRSYSTKVEYYDETNDRWEILKTGLTADQTMAFADYNINTDLTSKVYFGNQTDVAMRWTGAHATLDSALAIGDATFTLDTDDDIDVFSGSGSAVVCGTELAYASYVEATGVFTLSATSSIACASGREVAQAVAEVSSIPRGNIYMVADNRLFVSGVASSSQAVYFSEYGDEDDFLDAELVDADTAKSPGIFNLGEGGGAVTGMVQDENAMYFFKRSTIRKATISDDAYTLSTLKPFDSKGQTTGSMSRKGIFTGGNAVYFPTSDNQLMGLLRVEGVDYPQMKPISNIIQNTVDSFNFDDTAGVVFRDKAYFACKSNNTVAQNDTVLVYNIDTGKWDSPILGWNVSDWTIYDDGTTEELYFGDALKAEIYKVTDVPVDDIFDVKASWRSKQFDFGMPTMQKEITDMYVDGYISPNTTLTISLLLDVNGYTQKFSTDLAGTESDYIYDSSTYNVFGLSAFGVQRFGSQEDLSGKKRFRIYLGKSFRVNPFYTAQLEFASDGSNQSWEILNFGMKWRPYSQEAKRSLYKAFQ